MGHPVLSFFYEKCITFSCGTADLMPILTESVAHLIGLGHSLVHTVTVSLGIRHKLPESLGIAHQGLLLSGHRDFYLRRKYVIAMTQYRSFGVFCFGFTWLKLSAEKSLFFTKFLKKKI